MGSPSRKSTPTRQALDQAIAALRRGDKSEARSWAQIAASQAPDTEAPWLILAEVAKPHARVAYLERAQKINPCNELVRQALERAREKQLTDETQPVRRIATASPSRSKGMPGNGPIARKSSSPLIVPPKAAAAAQVTLPTLFVTLAFCLVAAWAIWPGRGISASPAVQVSPTLWQDRQGVAGIQAALVKPTVTPSPTWTFTPTATPTIPPTPTALPTATASSTATPLLAEPVQPPDGLLAGEYAAPQLPEGGDQLMVVSIHEQSLYAYQGGTLVYRFIVSTGSNHSTRTGTFSILDKIPEAYGADWNFWMPEWMGIYYAGSLEDGIHSLPVLPDGQYLWGNSLGTPVSYGCVVLGVQEAQDLFGWADIGTTVQIDP